MDKLYKDMTTAEQLRWLTDFSSFANEKMTQLAMIGDVWEQCSIKDMETGLNLINAFAYAREFVKNSLCYQDYVRRVSRLQYYVDRIKKDIGKDMVVRGANGETYAYIPALQSQSRRRGRPTREETLARVMGKTDEHAEQDEQIQKEKKIAALLGMEIVTATPKREKNNEELAAERAEREDKDKSVQISLFDALEQTSRKVDDISSDVTDLSDNVECLSNDINDMQTRLDAVEEKQSEKTDANLSSSLPRLKDLAWLLTPELAAEVDNVRNYRASAAAAAEKAKTMAELGAKTEDVARWAKEASVMTECYEKTFERVDGELAALYVRLREDEIYTSRFKAKHHFTDLSDLLKLLKPYYNKQDKTFVERVRKVIAEENPEAVARREEERKTKERVDAIVKYLTRKDKKASVQRVKTMEQRIAELEQLRGKEFADVYRPLLEKTQEEVKDNGKKGKDNKEN